jgi:hypothetical protein
MEQGLPNITLLGLMVTCIMGIVILILPRRYAPIPMIAIGMYMTFWQTINVSGFHFTMLRVIIIFGWARIVLRWEMKEIEFNEIDIALSVWAMMNFLFYTVREMSLEALVNRFGFAFDVFGFYFFFRCMIRSHEDCLRLIKIMAYLVIPLAGLMIIENTTGRNIFSFWGGVSEITMVRDGKLRCQGPFGHPILAGSFGAVLMPLLAGLWFAGQARLVAIMAAVASTVMVITSASSGPVLSFMAGAIALVFWKLRDYMGELRWVLTASIVALALIMKAPVWYIINRLSEIMGAGGGWHRSELITQAIMRIDEWWLYGTSYTSHWMPTKLFLYNEADITNQYILEGVEGGLITMILFIVIIVLCFRRVGLAIKAWDVAKGVPKYLPWALGSTLFAHIVTYMSVSYFDQMIIYWYFLIAMIAIMPKVDEEVGMSI